MKQFLLFIAAFGTALSIQAQLIRTPVLVGYTGLTAYSTHQSDVFAFTANQAQIASTQKFTAGMYSERRFMIKELGLYQLAGILPTSSGNFGLQTIYYGSKEYNETTLGLAYGRNLGEKLSIGTQFNYYKIQAAGYGNAGAVSVEAAALYKLSEEIQAGVHIGNPSRPAIGKEERERLPLTYSAGLGYDVHRNFYIGAEVSKTEGSPVGVNAGLQYTINNVVAVRGGIQTATSTVYFGLSFSFQQFRLHTLASVHPQLGVTPGLLLIYNQPTTNE